MIWEKININQFTAIRKVLNGPKYAEDKMIELASILSEKSVQEVESMPLTEVAPIFAMVQQLNGKPKAGKPRKTYMVNNWNNELICTGEEFSVAQWADFVSYAKDMENNLVEILSVVLIPKGHKYNDGYDIKALQKELGYMNVSDALGVCFFFLNRFLKRQSYILLCLAGWSALRGKMKIAKKAMKLRKAILVLRSFQ